jgi:DNA uptake protein ComE-like DNA-binding protein
MDIKKIEAYFKFSKSQRLGILLLLAAIVVFQLAYFFVNVDSIEKDSSVKQKWFSVQSQIDSLNQLNPKIGTKIYSFNPNFITDYKGYRLGMSILEIDRLLAFRKDDKYVNSAKEFQIVTKVSDSLLHAIAPYFKFPDWVKNKDSYKKSPDYIKKTFVQKEKVALTDINKATREDLIKIYGIGEVISLRIIRLKESLGDFVSMEQIKDVWGLSPEAVDNLNKHFKVFAYPNIKKIDINNASIKEIAQFPYFKYAIAKEIVTYRSMNGDIKNIEDLTKIKGFPVEKLNIIGVYLAFN